ncbi:hypothetical protein ABW19_dt0210048 [Dactylella cylindrospora]|nr:hypothetical protein ABW19_dt0210048 [Dactylella cylindrospora]
MYAKTLLFALLSVSLVNAHFTLRHPVPLGKSAANQDTGPCGGYSISESTEITNFYVDGDAIAYSSSHPQVKLLLRVVEGNTAEGEDLDWTQVFPIVEQNGAGDFCEPLITVPRELVGKMGVLQVIQNAVDGMLYACAYLNFVSGVRPSAPASCVNGTGVDAQFSSDPALEALMDDDDTDDEPSATSSVTSSAVSSPSATETPSSASVQTASMFACLLGLVVAMVFNTVA